jgi:hypothetical protein
MSEMGNSLLVHRIKTCRAPLNYNFMEMETEEEGRLWEKEND